MFYVATALIFDCDHKLLIYQRDDKPGIAYPNHWDLFGGIIEEGESPEQALVREVQEELGITLKHFTPFKEYDSDDGIGTPNRKYVFYAYTHYKAADLKLQEVGQQLKGIDLNERSNYNFANILGRIIDDFAEAGIQISE